ncbi:MAG: hypothetical protein HYU86_05105 [Chloroflexi bacterium]|nr:hypothetical protein [Chloroflexota bacterium]
MRRYVISILLGIIAFILTGQGGGAQEPIKVLLSDYVNQFPERVVFRLQAESSASEIDRVTLYYQIRVRGSQAYAYPDFSPGKRVTAQYYFQTNVPPRTYVPPGTDMSFYWVIQDKAGNKYQTESTPFVYEDVRFQWKSVSGGGITLYYYSFREVFAQQLLEEAQASVKRLSAQAGITYDRPMKIFAYDSKQDMDPALQERSEAYTRQTVTMGTVVSPQIMLLLGNHPQVKDTVAHEVSHMVIKQATENPYVDLPAWLDEGLAMNAEKNVAEQYQFRLNAAVLHDDLLSLKSLSALVGHPAEVTIFYAEAWSSVKYLLDTYGQEKMADLLRTFKEGNTADGALKKVYGFDVEGLDNAWRVSLGLKPRPIAPPSGARELTIPPLQAYGAPPQPPPAATPSTSASGAAALPWGAIGAGIGGVVILILGAFIFLARRGIGGD